jgi:hypothetical protein
MCLVYMRFWMWGCLYVGVSSLVGAVVLSIVWDSVYGILMALWSVVWLTIGIWLLRKYGTGWSE